MLVVFVDVVFVNDGDDVAAATRFEISVIIAVVIADGIRNNIDDISGKSPRCKRSEKEQKNGKTSTAPELASCGESLN